MDEKWRRLVRYLFRNAPRRQLDQKTISIFRFYEMMRDDPKVQPEEFF